MGALVRLVGPNRALEIFGVKLVGVTAENGRKLLFSLALLATVMVLARLARRLAAHVLQHSVRPHFWTRQGISVVAALVAFVGVLSVWFDDPTRLATALGLVTAGLAFALQRLVTALAGYVVLLRGQVFNVGDRIRMGGVRGDVIGLSFLQTKIMEMGEPPGASSDPATWVRSRQYTGRIVSVSNAQVFEQPVFNYTREFPWIWEELSIPVRYGDDWAEVERALLAAASRHSARAQELGGDDLAELARRSFLERADVRPRVFLRLTDDWVELTLRFLVAEHGIREVKDAIARDVLRALEARGIPVASRTFEVTRLPALRAEAPPARAEERPGAPSAPH